MKILPLLAGVGLVLALTAGCAAGGGSAWIVMRRMDLPLSVQTSGTLKAVESSRAILPSIPDVWTFKIAGMAPESRPIRKGMPLLILDPGDQTRELEKRAAERDKAANEIEKEKLDLRQRLLDLDRQLDEAQARLRKTSRKVEVPQELLSRVELEKTRLDLELAQAEVRSLEEQRDLQRDLGAAQLQILSGRRDRASQRVADLERGLREMTVPALRNGLVIYTPDYRGDKHKVGDTVTLWDSVLEVANLDRLGAEATVAEADVARIQVGQQVQLRLESDPERQIAARLARIDPMVRRQGWDNPRKVVWVQLELNRTDPDRMRPGMRFRGEIQVDRIARALALPMDAIALGPEGPVAYRAGAATERPVPVPVKLGPRSGDLIQVLAGLKEGDRVLRRAGPDLDGEPGDFPR